MKKALIVVALALLGACTSSAQVGTYTQTATVMCRSGELNCFEMQLQDSWGTLRGSYSLDCNTNAINNFTCHFALILDGVTYTGNVTHVTTYFPKPPSGSGPFLYNWSASGNGVTLTGFSPGNGHWGNCGLGKGACAYIEAGTTVTVQDTASAVTPFYPCGSKQKPCAGFGN